uniref:Copia protein n=1 Tax=Ananas comosus var. bracteatus TaxID=296719 RepID=A0A6V7PLI3_ANACO|nr:unnamed protein product [Ananas comosus var. bracteatus]
MAQGVSEILWLRRLMQELNTADEKPSILYCDNKVGINIAHNSVQHDRTKHIEIDRNFIKENLEKGSLRIPFVKSSDQLADILTKGVGRAVFNNIVYKMGMRNIYAPS